MPYCVWCEAEKADVEFGRQRKKPDLPMLICNHCVWMGTLANPGTKREYLKKRQVYQDRMRAGDEQRKQARKAYAATPEGRARHDAAVKAWIARHPEKRKAQIAANNALRDKKITRPEACEGCGCTGRVQAHHDDYSKPLEVRWFCTACHAGEHKVSRDLPR